MYASKAARSISQPSLSDKPQVSHLCIRLYNASLINKHLPTLLLPELLFHLMYLIPSHINPFSYRYSRNSDFVFMVSNLSLDLYTPSTNSKYCPRYFDSQGLSTSVLVSIAIRTSS